MPRLCAGQEGEPCIFGTKNAGQRAQTGPCYQRCIFCDPERMISACSKPKGLAIVKKSVMALSGDALAAATQRVPEAHREVVLSAARTVCLGMAGVACTFALTLDPRRHGQAQLFRGKDRCLFCDPTALGKQCSSPTGRKKVAEMMKRMSLENRDKVLHERIPSSAKECIERLIMHAPSGLKKKPAGAGPKKEKGPPQFRRMASDEVPREELLGRWRSALRTRCSTLAVPSKEAVKKLQMSPTKTRTTRRMSPRWMNRSQRGAQRNAQQLAWTRAPKHPNSRTAMALTSTTLQVFQQRSDPSCRGSLKHGASSTPGRCVQSAATSKLAT
eukprot:3463652-Amphidinium_carterae.2